MIDFLRVAAPLALAGALASCGGGSGDESGTSAPAEKSSGAGSFDDGRPGKRRLPRWASRS